MDTFAEIIARWPSAEELALDLDLAGANPGVTVRAWKRRNRIPSEYWERIIRAAERRKFENITIDVLLHAASQCGKAA